MNILVTCDLVITSIVSQLYLTECSLVFTTPVKLVSHIEAETLRKIMKLVGHVEA